MPSYDRALHTLRTWLDSWAGIGHVVVGMHRQGYARVDDDDDGPSEDEIDAELDAGRLIHVEPLASVIEYRWMADFTGTVRNARLRGRLEGALDGRGAFRRFKNTLLDFPAERERWFAFRDERLHTAAREWLGELGIEPTTASPASR